MLPARIDSQSTFNARAAQRELLLWTTRDGREIPLDEMTDDHIANALRVLVVWRSRAKKRDETADVVRDLRDAIERFKRIQRQRRKALPREAAPKKKTLSFRREGPR